jgi:Protein of unknown function (DUF2924)
VVETDRQIDLCSEHAKRPASVPGLWWCRGPIVGIASRRSTVEIPGHRSTGRRGGEPNADANCPSPRSPHALDDASLDELRCEWRRLYRSEPPRISRDLLIRGVGYRLQEIQHGGLGKSTRRKLKTLAKMFRTEGRVAPDPGLSLKPGARLVREWHGRTHTVTVTEDGFEYSGTTYPSLTKIAKKITGAHWSGPRFFGLISAVLSI